MVRVVCIVLFSLVQHTVEHQVLCSIRKFMIIDMAIKNTRHSSHSY